jgi:hypothetical protein
VGVLTLVLGIPSVAAPQVSSRQADTQANAPDLDVIVQSLEAAEQQNPAKAQGYTVTRSYKLFHYDEIEPVSQTTAEITFVPPDKKSYEIKQSSGISRGKNLVRDILDLESVPTESSGEISRQNYKFILIREEELAGALVYLLRIIPKRKEKNLLNGFVWVDTKTFRIQRIEGTPAKKPSWWLKDLDITLQYTDMDGLWLPTYMNVHCGCPFGGQLCLNWRGRRSTTLRIRAPEPVTFSSVRTGSNLSSATFPVGRFQPERMFTFRGQLRRN